MAIPRLSCNYGYLDFISLEHGDRQFYLQLFTANLFSYYFNNLSSS